MLTELTQWFTPALAQWFTPAIVILGFLFTARTIRNQRVDLESRMDRMETRLTGRIDDVETRLTGKIEDVETRLTGRIDGVESRLAARMDGLESRYSDLRDRMGRMDGTLDLLRKSFVGNGRGTPA